MGTHTHVPTNDARLLSNGTAYQSDVGMCGPYNGILGSKREGVINRTCTGYPSVFEVQIEKEVIFCATLISIDNHTNKVTKIQPIQQILEL